MKPHDDRDEPEGHREGWACQGRTAARPGHQNSAGTPCAVGAPVCPCLHRAPVPPPTAVHLGTGSGVQGCGAGAEGCPLPSGHLLCSA